jgi:hypothetical protein
MFNIWKRRGEQAFHYNRNRVVPVVAHAAVASEAIGDGRLLPLVILDTTHFPDIVDLFRVHDATPPGDADSGWVLIDKNFDRLGLGLQFRKPFETTFVIDFELTEHGSAVDLAMKGRAIYLQAGKPGDRLYRTMDSPRIVVELGAEAPKKEWEVIWQRAIKNRLRSEGVNRKEAKRLSPVYMEKMRDRFRGFGTATPGMYVQLDDSELVK